MKRSLISVLASVMLSAPAFADPSVYTPALDLGSEFTTLGDGSKIHSIQAGTGETVVFLHGLPASAYLWREVVREVGASHHAIAPDLPGYGYSDAPRSGDFGLTAAVESLSEYLNGLEAETFTLVVTDMGSVLGLNYAVHNADRIKGIVLSEAVFQPPEAFMAQLRPEHMEFIMAAQDPAFVKQITLDQPALVDMAMQANSITTLSDEVLANYRAPYIDPAPDHMEKRMVLNAVFGPDGLNNFGMMAHENASLLAELDVPILLVEADPGYMVNAPAVEYARTTFADLTVVTIDHAGHFFAEDNPSAFAKAVTSWMASQD
ncbi:MAG: alpha/beta fold hydrolase [Thalassovita sp.]